MAMRQSHGHACACAHRALDAYAPMVQFDELVHDGEPESGAGPTAPRACAVAAIERLKDACKVIRLDACAGVRYDEFERAARRGGYGNGDLATRRVLNGIFHEIQHDLFECGGVAPGWTSAGGRELDPQLLRARKARETVYDSPRDLLKVHVAEGHLLRSQKGVQGQQVVYQIRDAVKLFEIAPVNLERFLRDIGVKEAYLGIGPDDGKGGA